MRNKDSPRRRLVSTSEQETRLRPARKRPAVKHIETRPAKKRFTVTKTRPDLQEETCFGTARKRLAVKRVYGSDLRIRDPQCRRLDSTCEDETRLRHAKQRLAATTTSIDPRARDSIPTCEEETRREKTYRDSDLRRRDSPRRRLDPTYRTRLVSELRGRESP